MTATGMDALNLAGWALTILGILFVVSGLASKSGFLALIGVALIFVGLYLLGALQRVMRI